MVRDIAPLDVLVIEDDAVARNAVLEVLRERGHTVTQVASAEEGLELWDSRLFQLVLLDCELPQMDGLEACRRMRASARGEMAHILVVTARAASRDIALALAAGADDYLVKPFELYDLEMRLDVGERHAALRSARARAEEERDRLDQDLRRARVRLQGILVTAMAAHSAQSEAQIFEILGEAVIGVGLNCHIATLVESPLTDHRVEIRHIALTDRLLSGVIRVLKRPIIGIEMDVAAVGPYADVFRDGRIVAVPDVTDWLRQALPWLDDRSVRVIGRLRGVATGACAPITDGRHTFGVLSMWGAALSDADLPTLGLLGHYTGTALAALRTREAESERARLDGAIKTARLVAHELGNQLSFVLGYGEMLTQEAVGAPQEYAREMVIGARGAGEIVARLQRIIRFEETDFGGGPMLDLAAATIEPPADER